MKNLKKVLALVLALSTVFGLSATAGAAATDFNDYDEIENKEAVEVMNALNVIGGHDTGDFKPDGYLTRAEMCKMVAYVMNGGKEPVLGSTGTYSYTDTSYSWAKDYIEYATSMGIVGGVGGGKFNPDGTLTGVQAAKMMLTAMGYDANVFGFGGTGWDVNVNRYANETGLYKNLGDLQPNLPITRDDAAQLMYNAIQATMVRKSWDQNLENGTITEGYTPWYDTTTDVNGNAYSVPHTLLSEKFDGAIQLGYLTSFDYDATKKTWTYDFDSSAAYFNGATITKNGIGYESMKSTVDYTDLFGQQVKVIYNVKDQDVLYGVYPNDSSVVVTGASGDVSKVNDVADTVTVSGKDYKFDSKAATASAIPVYMNNGGTAAAAYLDTQVEDYTGYTFKMVDNNGDGKIDAMIKTPVSVAQINYVGKDQVQFTTDDVNMQIAAVDIDDLTAYEGYAVGDWVYFTKDQYTSTQLHTIEKAELKNGTLEAVRGGTNVNDYDEYKLGGAWYNKAQGGYNLDDAEVSDTVEYVTLGSTVFHLEIAQSSFVARDIALVVSVGVEENSIGNISGQQLMAKLLFGDGSTSTVALSKVGGTKVNATKYLGDDKTYNAPVGGVSQDDGLTESGVNTKYQDIVDALVGNLVTFKVSSGSYELTKVSSTNKMGFRTYIDSIADGKDQGYKNGKIAGELLADDALIFVLAMNDGTVDGYTGGLIAPNEDNAGALYSGKEFKNEYGADDMTVAGANEYQQFRGQVLTTVQNGFEYVKVAVVCVDELPDINVGSNYGYLTENAYRTEEENKLYLNFTLWTSNGEVKGKVQTNDAPETYPAGALISYDVVSDGVFKNVNLTKNFVTTAVTAWDAEKGNIKFADNTSSVIDKTETQVIYVDTAEKSGAEGGAIQIAPDTNNDRVGDQNNVRYVGNDNMIAVLLVDVNNKIAPSPVAPDVVINNPGNATEIENAIEQALESGATVDFDMSTITTNTNITVKDGQSLNLTDLPAANTVTVALDDGASLELPAGATNVTVTAPAGAKVVINDTTVIGQGGAIDLDTALVFRAGRAAATGVELTADADGSIVIDLNKTPAKVNVAALRSINALTVKDSGATVVSTNESGAYAITVDTANLGANLQLVVDNKDVVVTGSSRYYLKVSGANQVVVGNAYSTDDDVVILNGAVVK